MIETKMEEEEYESGMEDPALYAWALANAGKSKRADALSARTQTYMLGGKLTYT